MVVILKMYLLENGAWATKKAKQLKKRLFRNFEVGGFVGRWSCFRVVERFSPHIEVIGVFVGAGCA